jgi:hypothetical protein
MKHVKWIVMLTRANESSCWKNVAKKFVMLTVKQAMPSMDHANHGGNQVIPLARREFDGNHRGLRHT